MSMTNNMALVHRASNAAMVTVKSSQVYRVPPQGNQGERSQQEKKGQEELRSGTRLGSDILKYVALFLITSGSTWNQSFTVENFGPLMKRTTGREQMEPGSQLSLTRYLQLATLLSSSPYQHCNGSRHK